MLAPIIHWSLKHRYWVLLITLCLFLWGIYAMRQNTIDVIPDLSENQVIVFTEWKGQSPQIIEDQITYPLLSQLKSIARTQYVRGNSMFGMSFIYVIFEEGVDIYWARERVSERLQSFQKQLPEGVSPQMGPDGTGVGHILWYTLEAAHMDLGTQRVWQDWYVKYALERIDGVSEVASFGGYEPQYEITLDPYKLSYYKLSVSDIKQALNNNNTAGGGNKITLNNIGYIIQMEDYLKSQSDIENVRVQVKDFTPVLIKDIAVVQKTPRYRLGIVDRDGTGERVGGIIVLRYGADAIRVIEQVKAKIKDLQKGLPDSLTIDIIYNRATLIQQVIAAIQHTLAEEIIVVSLIVFIFMMHWRSALSIVLQIPLSIALSFILLNLFGISSNIMSLTGIALAISVIVDNGIIISENVYKRLCEKTQPLSPKERLSVIASASQEVTRGVFFATLIIIASFLPVFILSGKEGRLFHPLAWTKTFIIIIDAVLILTLAPVLLSFFMKGPFKNKDKNILLTRLTLIYQWLLQQVFKFKKTTLFLHLVALIGCVPLLLRMGTEFMPPLDEQSILFMPTTLPDISQAEIKRILQLQDRILKSFPEVDKVLGKAGRANTITDNAPLSMIETLILLKPKNKWRKNITKQQLIQEMNERLQIPGVQNGWTQPIINRINMLATGIRSDVGIKIYGDNSDTLNRLAQRLKKRLSAISGVRDIYAEQISGSKYLSIQPDRMAMNRYGISTRQLNEWIGDALGGQPVTYTLEGRKRFPVSLRLAQDYRNSIAAIEQIPFIVQNTERTLGEVARAHLTEGPSMIVSENGQLRSALMFNVQGRDLGQTVREVLDTLHHTPLPDGYFLEPDGQYKDLLHSRQTLLQILPLVALIIFVLLYFAFRSFKEALLSLITLPFALIGGVAAIYIAQIHLSVAVAVGFIALLGVAVETGIVMTLYLNDGIKELTQSALPVNHTRLTQAVLHAATRRLRPKLMTASVALFGLAPVLWSQQIGADVMKPIVLPIIGGIFTSSIHILLVTPLIFLMTQEYELKKRQRLSLPATH